MEETLLNAFIVVVSLLLSKEQIDFHDQHEGIIAGMRDHEHSLLQEGAKLEQGEHSVAMELPHSYEAASQSHPKLPSREGHVSDVKDIMPNVRTTVLPEEQMSPAGDQNNFRQKALEPDDQEKRSNVDQSFSGGDEELSEKPKYVQIETHHEKKDDWAASLDQKNNYSWYLWKTFSLFSLLRFLKWILKLDFKPKPKRRSFLNETNLPHNICTNVSHLDYKTITSFYHQCVLLPASNSWHTCEFVEGFVNDLLETVRTENAHSTDIKIGDFIGVGSLYEQWASKKSIVCDMHVPIIPTKQCSFEFELLRTWTGSSFTLHSRVKTVKGSRSCLCSNSNQNDDMLCLLHPDKTVVAEDYINGPLCQDNSPYLSKKQLAKWFRTAVRSAWKESCHKYDFELIFRNTAGPVRLKVRFRSGKVILFNIIPVVQFQDSEAHLVSYLSSDRHSSDTHWPLCFARYENALLQHLTKTLPDNSCHIRCLQILSFLHKHQIGLTGKCGLTSYHLKNVFFNLLLASKPSSWQLEEIGHRLNDMLTFLHQRLQAKVLHHALVGNPLVPSHFEFPKEFRKEKPINLFLPLMSNEELYFKTNKHFVEMIRNIPVLIYEYSTK